MQECHQATISNVEVDGDIRSTPKLHKYIDKDDVEWQNLSLFGWKLNPYKPISLFYFIYLSYLCLIDLIDGLSPII